MAFYDEDINARPAPAPLASAGNAKTLGFFTGIIAIIVGVNGLVTSCAKERSDLEAAQRAYIQAEETFWQKQYADLGLVFQMEKDTSARLYRLQALYLAGGLHVFEPERAGVTDKDRLTTTFDFLFLKFNKVFQEPGSGLSNKEIDELGKIVNQVEAKNYINKDQRLRLGDAEQALNQSTEEYKPTTVGDTSVQGGSTASQTPTEPRPSLVELIAGKREGYDFDIFWCAISDETTETRNYKEATAVGKAISAKASIASQMIGRVRVRALPEGRQGFGYPRPSETMPWNVRYDSGDKTEEQIAKEITTLKLEEIQFVATRSYTNTKYYISLFVCHSPTRKTEAKKEK